MVASADNMDAKDSPWTVETLIGAAERIIASDPQLFAHPESENKKDLNVRLIRDYVVREFIPRPERMGREARFGLNHLVQLLAVRVLLRSQKWSLPAIKASFVTTSSEELLNGLLNPVRNKVEAEYNKATGVADGRARVATECVQTPRLNPAQLLLEQFKEQFQASKQPQPKLSSSPTFSGASFSMAARAAPAPASPAVQRAGSKLHIELEPGCELVIDAQRMQSLTSEEVERLAEALKSRLKDEAAR
jgi:hypothetical protein